MMPAFPGSRAPLIRAPVALVAVLAAVLVTLPACGSTSTGGSRPADRGLTGVVRRPPLEVGAVRLPDVSSEGAGSLMAMRARPGGLLVVYFGFTHCPDVCPTTLSDLGRALDRLEPSQRRRVRVAFVTVDPERDSARVMHAYLRHFVQGGHALRTEDPAQLTAAREAFRVTATRITYPGQDPAAYGFEHSAATYVVDAAGRVILEWPFGTRPSDMEADLRALLQRVG